MANHSSADNWQNTIISFESPHRLRDLCIAEGAPAETAETDTGQQKFKIRLANTDDRRESSSILINKRYSWRGYSTGVESSASHKPNRITLTADVGQYAVGTMTLCFDSEFGLPADEIYKDMLDVLREAGRKLCEPTKLAIDDSVRSKRVFASLIHISYIYAHNIHGFTDYVIEVNPRHAMFYKKMLGFHEIGEERNCPRVNAPALLLGVDLAYMGDQIEKFGGKMEQAKGEKSFYPYFFSKKDEIGITERLLKKD